MNTRLSPVPSAVVLTLLLTAGVFTPTTARACSIPVFRYALQFWEPDNFDALVFHKGELDEAAGQAVQKLTDTVNERIGANVNIQKVDLADEKLPEQLGKLWQAIQVPDQETLKLPHVLTLYPQSYGPSGAPMPAEGVSLAELRLDSWLISPARKTVTERLAKGESAVWVVLGIGDEEKDAAAMKTLTTTLAKLEKTLELPEQVPEPDLLYESDAELNTELRVAFSTLALSRDDDAEKHFVNHLLNSESDLRDFEEPMVFAVFGRGRALPALVGKGINEDVISEVAAFLVGPCSCQVKAENPGFDLLLAADWEMLLQKANAAISQEAVATEAAATGVAAVETLAGGPPAASVSESTTEAISTVVDRTAAAPPLAEAAPESADQKLEEEKAPGSRGRMLQSLLVVAGLGLAALVIGTAIIMKRNATVG